jgi:5,10-methylenetetrahydrofolate reductase
VNDQTIFEQRPDKVQSDLRRAKEVQVVTAFTTTGDPAVFIAGKQLRLLLPAEHALRIARDIIDRLGDARAPVPHPHYRTYTLQNKESHGTDTEQ